MIGSILHYPIQGKNFNESFEQLTDEEKEYTYFLTKACWEGVPIVLFQISYESPALFIIFQNFFSSFKQFQEIKKQIFLKTNGAITDVAYKQFIIYAAKFYANTGNYLAFGSKKFIPELNAEKFEQILQSSSLYDVINYTWKCIKDIIYDDSSSINTINLEDRGGKNSYYLGGIKEEQIKTVDQYLQNKDISLINTRILMINPNKFVCLIGSIDEKKEELSDSIIAYYGEFSSFLRRVNLNLEEAQKVCGNETEKKMLQHYIDSFQTGSIDKHKDSQREWVKNKQPVVEMNIGWIERYIDPIGLRASYGGWVALTDKEKSKKFNTLVSKAEKFLNLYPWDKEFENPTFIPPDFGALDVVCFASNLCPFGISLPNYQEIKDHEGSKNISLSNAYPSYQTNNLLFCSESDFELLKQFGKQAMTLQSASHELLGHGSGRFLKQNEKGEFNFEKGILINPITNEPVDKYYLYNESYDSKFSDIGNSFEECRADLAGLFFGFNKDLHQIFDVNESNYKDVVYVMWFIYIRKGLDGLQFFNEENKKWGQVQSENAYVFTRFILENQIKGQEIITFSLEEDKKAFSVNINKEMILCYGQELTEKMFTYFHIWRATGDCDSAKEFYDKYSLIDDFFMKIRKIVCDNAQPRPLDLYHNLIYNAEDKSISLVEYPETMEGIIQSYVERFRTDLNKDIYEQWTKYDTNFIK